eukprot:11531810-Alexandrium_andersonii.AAC.1
MSGSFSVSAAFDFDLGTIVTFGARLPEASHILCAFDVQFEAVVHSGAGSPEACSGSLAVPGSGRLEPAGGWAVESRGV